MIQNSFKRGLLDGVPIGLGYFSVAFAFGIMAIQCGLSPLEALLISMTNLTSAGQLAGVPIIAGGGSLIEMAATQLIINSRYALMSVSLSQKLESKTNLVQRLLVAFGNTDEIFAVSMANNKKIGKIYFYALMIAPWLGWSGGTIIGALAGAALPEIITSALGVAIYAMLVAVVVPKVKEDKWCAICVAISVLISCGFEFLPLLKDFASNYGGFVIIICATVASTILALIHPVETEEQANEC
ncbi:MAG: AzlC family ABC transporter permease [Clostridia bacterium]|nr:AzlC family ABC transporter permease [Clostridia bacterium]